MSAGQRLDHLVVADPLGQPGQVVRGVAEPLVEDVEVAVPTPTAYSAVMPMPPCSWMASWPMWRPARLICRPTRSAASATASGSPVAIVIVAQSTMLWASSRETYMSAARKVRAWKVLRVTPNCLRLLR